MLFIWMAFKLFFFLLKKCNFFFHHFEEQWGLVCSICSGSTLSLNYDKYLIASVFFCYSHIYSKCGWMGMTTRISPWRDHHCDRIKLNARILEPHLYESIANKWSFALFHTDRHTHTHRIMIVIRLTLTLIPIQFSLAFQSFRSYFREYLHFVGYFRLHRFFSLMHKLFYIMLYLCICSIPYITLSRQYNDNVLFRIALVIT